jgi:hypothetical protein
MREQLPAGNRHENTQSLINSDFTAANILSYGGM